MEQGLRILIQLIIEFAPAIASFVQKQNEANLALRKHEETKQIGELLLSENGTSQISYTGFYQDKIQQLQLAVYHRETQLKVATQQRETALKLPEVNKILDSWPLRLYPSQILQSYPRQGCTPLKIFLAPPKVKFDKFDREGEESDIELISAEGLREFLSKYYSLHSSDRPVEFLAGAWDSKRFHSESSIKALFGMLKTEPTLILESEIDGDYLNFRIGYWGLGQENYFYKTISRLPYKEIIEKSAKNRALEWKKIRDELVKLGENIEEINIIGGDNVKNLEILEKVEKWQVKGIDVSKLSVDYQVNHQDFEQLARVLTTCYCLVASWVADAYHLIHYDVPPLLPKLLPSLLEDDALDLQSLQAVVSGYKQLYQALETQRGFWIPELALQLAQSLSHLPDTTWTQEQAEYSINAWLQLRQLQPEINPLEAMLCAVKVEDAEYVEKLKEYFTAIGDTQSILIVEEILKAIENLKQQPRQEYVYEYKNLTGHSANVTSVAISSDGQIVSGCEDKTIKLWNLETGKLIRTLNENWGEVSSLAVSPNGKLLAVGSSKTPQNNVKVWNLATGKLVWTLLGHHKPVNVVNISSDGQILASGSNKIKIWDLYKGERVSTLWHSCAVNAIAISSSSKVLVSGTSDHKIRLWNPRTGDPLRTLTGHKDEVNALAISPDEQFLYSGSADKTIKIWHLQTGKVLHTLKGHADVVKTLALSPDGKFLYSGSADKTIKIWRLPSGEPLHTLTGHSGAVNSLAVTQDGQFLVSGSSDKTIRIWQVFGE